MTILRYLALLATLLAALPCFADYDVTVTGTTGGNIWGSGPYTSDSVISSAAVHSGIITLGQTAIIRVRSEGNLSNYKGSTRNGVTTMDYASSWAAVSLSLVTSSQAPTVSLSAPVSVTTGAIFTVTVNATDANGDLNAHSLRYQGMGLVNWWAISGSSTSHSETITAPPSPGIIYFRTECTDVAGNGATSGWIPVEVVASSNAVPVATITAPTSATINTTFSATVSATDANSNLASLVMVKQNEWPPHQTLHTWSASGGTASQNGNVTAPSSATTVYLRSEAIDTAPAKGESAWYAVAITSAPSASVSASPSSVSSGGTLTVSYTGAPSTSSWIGLFVVGTSDSAYLAYQYVPNSGSGTRTFTLNSPTFTAGPTYEARLFQDGGYTVIATSNSFQIASGATYTLTVNGGTGSASGLAGNAQVNIQATPPTGMVFSHWTRTSLDSGSFGNANASATTYTLNGASAVVQANFGASPAITTQPQSQIVTAGANVTFSVSATGTPAPTYQWRKNGTNISGATQSSYTLTNVNSGHAGTYSVVVSNTYGSVTSSNVTLTVNVVTIDLQINRP